MFQGAAACRFSNVSAFGVVQVEYRVKIPAREHRGRQRFLFIFCRASSLLSGSQSLGSSLVYFVGRGGTCESWNRPDVEGL